MSEQPKKIRTGVNVERKVFSLTQLNRSLENLFEEKFGSSTYWITCEIAKIDQRNGHRYLELTDSTDGIKTAQSRAAIWRGQFEFIRKTIEKAGEEVNKVLAPGNKVLVKVTLNFHKIFGLSLTIVELDPYFTLGDIERQKQETWKRLQKEELVHRQKELPLSVLSKRIALIGSPDTSGYTDFLQELLGNDIYSNFALKEFHTRVQGEEAVKEIARAIRQADGYDVDAIVLVRGGGSKMDLHTFNHYDICKAIAMSIHPVVTGIGHETDITLADMVSHHYEKTPTAAAKHFYMKIGVFSAQIREAFDAVKFNAMAVIQQQTRTLGQTNTGIHQKVVINLKTASERLRLTTDRTVRLVNTHIRDHREQLNYKLSELKTKLGEIIFDRRSRVISIQERVLSSSKHFLALEKDGIERKKDLVRLYGKHLITEQYKRVELIEQKIKILNPMSLLKGGYTLSTVDGKDVKDIDENAIGKTMKTLTIDRVYYSEIKDIKTLDDDRKGDQ